LLQKVILWTVTGLAAFYFLYGTPALYQRLVCLCQVEQSDAINVERALIMLRGDNLYPDVSQGGPYLYTAYPPVYFWLESQILPFVSNPWLPGRLLALLGYLGCGLLIVIWGWGRWGRTQSVLISLIFLCSPSWARWGTMDRPDTLYLFLNFMGFLLLYEYMEESKRSRSRWVWVMTAGLLNGMALGLKQTAYSLMGAFGLYALVKRVWKDFVLFAISAAAVIFPIVFWEMIQSHGLLYDHTVRWLNTGYDWHFLGYWLSHDFFKEAGWLATAVLVMAFFKKVPFFLFAQMLMATFNLLSLGRAGGAENYWLEFLLYGIFFIGELYGRSQFRFWIHEKNKVKFSWAFASLLVLGLFCDARGQWPTAPSADVLSMKGQAKDIYTMTGEHLALDLDLPLMEHKKIWIQPFEYTAMVQRGFWSTGPLKNDIRLKFFTTIELYDMSDQYLLPPDVVQEIKKDYHLGYKRFGRLWYVPNKNQQ
jgi:4-amino-4-deoxy-L-arabinose transferase-like glycosyltransferase